MKRGSSIGLAVLFAAAAGVGAWWTGIPAPPLPTSPLPAARQPAEPPPAIEKNATEPSVPATPPAAVKPLAPQVLPVAPSPPGPDPARAAELRAQADAFLKNAQILEAVDAFEKALEADPTSAKNHGDYGRLLRDLTAIDKALYHLRRATDLEPSDPDRWIELANAYYLKPDPGKAWEAEKRAREADPNLELRRGARGLWERSDDTTPARE